MVRRGLGGLRPVVLEEGLGLFPTRLRVALGLVPQLVRVLLRLLDDAGGLGVGVRAALLHVALGVAPDLVGVLLRQRAVLGGLLGGGRPQLPRLLLGQPEDLLDAGTETGVRRALLLGLSVQLLHPAFRLIGSLAVVGKLALQCGDAPVHLGRLVATADDLEALAGGAVGHGSQILS